MIHAVAQPVLCLIVMVLLLGAETGHAQTATPTKAPTATPTATTTPTIVQVATPTQTTTPTGRAAIVGLVYRDSNANALFDGREEGIDDVQLTLERIDVVEKARTAKSDSKGKYRFDDVAIGSYLLTLRVPSNYRATTTTRRDAVVVSSLGSIEDFGLERVDGNENDSNGSGNDNTSNSSNQTSSRSNSSARARAAAAPARTPTPMPTATPTATATPTILNRLRDLVSLSQNQFVSFTMQGQTDDNGRRADFAAEGNVLEAKDMAMRLAINGKELEIVVVGPNPYERAAPEEYWDRTSIEELRRRHGVLSPLDVLALPLLADQTFEIRRMGLEQVEGQVLQRYQIDVHRPPPPPVGAGPAAAAPRGGQAKPAIAAAGPDQLVVLEGRVELWVSEGDGLIHTAHLALGVPSARRDYTGRLNPAWMDVWLRFSDHNVAFTINEPRAEALVRPTDVPVAVRVPPVAGPAAAPAPAPAPARAQAQAAPAPDRRSGPPPAAEAAEAAVSTGPVIPDVSADQRSRDAEEALVALASAAGPRDGSEIGPDRVVLAVPWETAPVSSPAAEAPINDGVAALRLILEAYGVTTQLDDLEALADGWLPPGAPHPPVPLETLIRIGERGSLRALGPTRGPGGGEWTATLARDFVQRGYPVLMRVRPGLLASPPSAAPQADRYVVLVGREGEELLYHDPTAPDGARLRISADQLDQAWAGAALPRQGAAFGFGVNMIGLLQGATARAAASATTVPTATARAAPTSAPTVVVAALTPIPPLEARASEGPAQSVEQSQGWSFHPALLALFAVLACGVGFVVARFAR